MKKSQNKNYSDSSYINDISDFIEEVSNKNLYYLKAISYETLAKEYWDEKKFALALENYLYSYAIYSIFSIDQFPEKPEYLYDIAGGYFYFRDFETAKKYFLEVWNKIPYEKINNPVSKINTLAMCYGFLDNIDSSTYYYKMGLEHAEKSDNVLWIGIISGNLAGNYILEKKYDEAIPLFKKNIEISFKHKNLMDLVGTYSKYGALMLIKKEYKEALKMQIKSLEILNRKFKYNYQISSKIYPNVARAYAANGNMKMAYAYLDSAYIAKDLYEKERNSLYVSGVQHKIDIERHKAEIKKSQDELKNQKLYRNILTIGIFVLFLTSGIFYLQRRKIKKTQIKLLLSEKLASLGQISAGIAHEVNTSLGAIKSSVEESLNAFPEILSDLLWFIKTLDEKDLFMFLEFVAMSSIINKNLTTKEEREIKNKLSDKLSEYGIENSRFLSGKLVQAGVYEVTPSLENIIKLPEYEKLILLAFNILNLKHCNQNIKLAVDKASRIVYALKTYLYTSVAKEMEPITLKDNLDIVLTIYNNLLKQGIEVIKNYEDVPEIVGCPDQLNQVWTNLIVNAVQAMENKGVLTIGLSSQGGFVTVSIKDTGKGIPKKIQNKIFDPFFTTKSSGEGSGIGLDVTKRILKDHSSSISFDSVEGQGTTFFVKLPIKKENEKNIEYSLR